MGSHFILSSEDDRNASSSKPCRIVKLDLAKKEVHIYRKKNGDIELIHTESETRNNNEERLTREDLKKRSKDHYKANFNVEAENLKNDEDKLKKPNEDLKIRSKENWKAYINKAKEEILKHEVPYNHGSFNEDLKIRSKENWKTYLNYEKDNLNNSDNKVLRPNIKEELRIHSKENCMSYLNQSDKENLKNINDHHIQSTVDVGSTGHSKEKDQTCLKHTEADVDKNKLMSDKENKTINSKENGNTPNHAVSKKQNHNADKPKRLNFMPQEDSKPSKNEIINVPHSLTENKILDNCSWRRRCGCLKTSEKLKELLKRFPSPPPPPPPPPSPILDQSYKFDHSACISVYCTEACGVASKVATDAEWKMHEKENVEKLTRTQAISRRLGRGASEIVNLIQIAVTASALALYYIIYFYMQLVYYMLVSAMFFHHADGAMKITIGVVTITSLIVGFNLLLRVEKIMGITINE